MAPETYAITPSTARHNKSQLSSPVSPSPPHRSSTFQYQKDIECSSQICLLPNDRAASTPPERPRIRHSHLVGFGASQSTATETPSPSLHTSLAKKRSRYFDEAFAYRESINSAKARSLKDSLVTAQVKLNYCPPSEQEFVVDFAFLLSEIYQRPVGCIMVLLNTDFTILLESSTDPAYQVSLTALTTEVAATKNRRAAGLIQDFMTETANIPSTRGVFTFHTSLEENMVVDGMGRQVAIQKSDGQCTTDANAMEGHLRQRSGRSRKSSLIKPTLVSRSIISTSRSKTPCFPEHNSTIDMTITTDRRSAEKKVKKRKSLMALLGFQTN